MRYLKFKGKNRLYVQTGDGTEYASGPRNNICLVEVQDNHVAELLLKMCGCCDNKYVCFSVATEVEIARWKSNG